MNKYKKKEKGFPDYYYFFLIVILIAGAGFITSLVHVTTIKTTSPQEEFVASLQEGVESYNNAGGCNNCLRPILEQGNERVEDLLTKIDQYVLFGQSTCNKELGIYDVESYFPALTEEYDEIIRFDNVRSVQDYNDASRTNITYFPAVPRPFPGGTAAGVVQPVMKGNVLNHTRFQKFQSVPYSIGFFFNLSMATISPTDPRLSVFIKSVEERGENNYEHRRYKAALTKSKVEGRYAERIKRFVANVRDSWVLNKAPLLSSFKAALIDFFLDIHLGDANHPQFAKEYFNDFLFFVSTVDTNAVSVIRTMKGHMNTKCVREYFAERVALIVENSLTDTITWHWIQAGMNAETVIMEALHNIVAFAQFDHTIQLLVTQAMNTSLTPGTGGNSFLKLFYLAGLGYPLSFALSPPTFINTTLYNGTPEELQMNVMREYLRIMLPNNLWFSTDTEDICPTCSPHKQSRHIPQLIQIRAEYEKQFPTPAAQATQPWNTPSTNFAGPGFVTGSNLYGRYDPMRYTNFMAKFSDASYGGSATSPAFDHTDKTTFLLNSIGSFTRSPVDNETQIPLGDASMIPVFATPIYAPFGIGARRCPGEIFNQKIIFELFDAIKCLTFYDDCTLNPSRCNPSSPDYTHTPIPLAPFKAVPDSLFVRSIQCPA